MTARAARWIGGVIVAVCAAAYAAMLALMSTTPVDVDNYVSLPVLLMYPLIGAVIVSRQPRNTIGWILVAAGAFIATGLVGAASVEATLDSDPAYWQQIVGLWANTAFLGGLGGLVLSLAFAFPTGRTLSPIWRTAAGSVALLFTGSFAFLAVRPGPLMGYFAHSPQLTNPFGVPWLDAFTPHTNVLAVLIGAFIVVTSLLAIIARFRHSRGVERLQLQWFSLAISLVGIGLVLGVAAHAVLPDQWSVLAGLADAVFFTSAAFGIPLAIGTAILRYQLYDIGRLVNRGLVYLALTLSLALVYLGLVLLLGTAMRSVSGQSSSLVTAASTLLVAVLFRPLRSGIQRVIDQRFYRRRYDTARMIEEFSTRLRDDVDIDAVRRDLQATAQQAMQPAHVSLWLRAPTRRA